MGEILLYSGVIQSVREDAKDEVYTGPSERRNNKETDLVRDNKGYQNRGLHGNVKRKRNGESSDRNTRASEGRDTTQE